jgi:hypothetical protein
VPVVGNLGNPVAPRLYSGSDGTGAAARRLADRRQ